MANRSAPSIAATTKQPRLASVAALLRDLDLNPVDAGPLASARYIEPAGMLIVQLAYNMGLGPNIGTKFLRG